MNERDRVLEQGRARRAAGTMRADEVFFPVAAAYASLAVPLWLASLQGWLPPWPAHRHAHELLFGYALAVVAGYLVGRMRQAGIACLLLAWLAARVAALCLPETAPIAALPEVAFSLSVALVTALPFFRAAKKAENRMFAPVLLGFFACDAAYQAGSLMQSMPLQEASLSIALDVYALLIAMMGGRILPAAVAGHEYRRGRVLRHRVQPVLERTTIAAMLAMIACEMFPGTRPAAGAFAVVAAAATAVRAARWRLWTVLDTPQLWALGLAYAWLVPGLVLKGHALLSYGAATAWSQHALAIGALGTTTLVMMGRTRVQRVKGSLASFGDIALAALLLGAATMARLAVPAVGGALATLWLAALCWSAAFGLLLRRLLAPARARER